MSSVLKSKIESMLSSLQKTVELASTYGTDDLKDINIYAEIAKEICEVEIRAENVQKAINEAKTKETVAEFDTVYEATLKKGNSKPTNTSSYKAFINQAEMLLQEPNVSQSQNEDDDISIENIISDIDPITKLPIENPVRNKICGHHYDKNSIEQSIKVNSRLRCPVAGCGHKTYVKLSNLVDDPVFMKQLRQQRRAQQSE